jgi:putative FmdB family regulatory protein
VPIYEYRCQKGHTFEVRQGFEDEPATQCEVCGAPVKRVFHPIAVHFKGSGFYNTDYGTRQRSREMKESKEAAKSESSKSEGAKSESSKASGSNSNSDSSGSKSDSGAKKSESKASAGN